MSTLISWSDEVWNPSTGCDRVSPVCAHCYALQLAGRYRRNPKMIERGIYQRDGGRASGPGFGLTLRPEVLEKPLHWRAPKRIFVNSMSDLFHDEIPDEYLDRIFAVMALCPQHTFQVLTKRIERAHEYLGQGQERADAIRFAAQEHFPYVVDYLEENGEEWIPWTPLPNVLIGPTVENQAMADKRLPVLAEIHALGWRTMVSYEPALTAVDFRPWLRWSEGDCSGCTDPRSEGTHQSRTRQHPESVIRWLICGGESGSKRRPFNHEWMRTALEQARLAEVPFFAKQDGAYKSEVYDTLPDDLKVREFPT